MKATVQITPPHTPSTIIDDVLTDAGLDGYKVFSADGVRAVEFDCPQEDFNVALFALSLAGLLGK